MNISPQIAKEFIEGAQYVKYKENFKNVFSASYNSVSIQVFQCPLHSNEFFIESNALGVTLGLLYWINSMSISIEEILEETYKDFCTFVVAARIEENETQH